MTTESEPASAHLKALTEVILKGDVEQAARLAAEMSQHRSEVNDLVDTISDTMNIVADLHEVERYSVEQVENCERAAEKALEVLQPKIRVEQTKVSGRVMVASLEGDPHNFDKTLLIAMLEIGGFTALDGGIDMSPQDVVRKVAELKPDILAVPLVTESAAKNLIETASLIGSGGPRMPIIAYGKGASNLSAQAGIATVEDSLGALSKIAEQLILRK